MAKITIVIDTGEETVSGDIDGKDFPSEINSVYINTYDDYRGKKNLTWNVSICHPTEDADFRACTNFCSAGISIGTPIEKARADVFNFLSKNRRR